MNQFSWPGINKILIGNKCDLTDERRVSYEEGQELAKIYGIKFLESSAKTSINVYELFKMMTSELIERLNKKALTKLEKNTFEGTSKGIGLKEIKTNIKKKECCK